MIITDINEELDKISSLIKSAESEMVNRDHMVTLSDVLHRIETVRGLAMEQHVLINARLNVSSSTNRMSYADAVKKPDETTTVLVYPKSDDAAAESCDTLASLKQQLNPAKLLINIERTRYIRNAGVAITLSNKEDAKKFTSQLKPEQYECKMRSKRNPFVKLHGVSIDTVDSDIKSAVLRARNTIHGEDDQQLLKKIKIIRRGKIREREDVVNVFILLEPAL